MVAYLHHLLNFFVVDLPGLLQSLHVLSAQLQWGQGKV